MSTRPEYVGINTLQTVSVFNSHVTVHVLSVLVCVGSPPSAPDHDNMDSVLCAVQRFKLHEYKLRQKNDFFNKAQANKIFPTKLITDVPAKISMNGMIKEHA